MCQVIITGKYPNIHFGVWYIDQSIRPWWRHLSFFRFKSDKWIFIHGVGVYGISSSIPDLKFSVHVQLYNEEQAGSIPVLPGNQQGLLGSATKEGNARTYDFRMPFKIMFENPLAVVPDVVYSLRATLTVSAWILNAFPTPSGWIFIFWLDI